MTRQQFLAAYKAQLTKQFTWPNEDPARLEKFIAAAERTLSTKGGNLNVGGPAAQAAWQAIGGRGAVTLKRLRELKARERDQI